MKTIGIDLSKFNGLTFYDDAVRESTPNPVSFLPDMESVQRTVLARMKAGNITEAELSRLSGTSETTVRNMLGRRPVRIRDADRIFAALDIRTETYPAEYAGASL